MEYLVGIIDYGVIGLLILMSIVAVSIAIERHLTYRKIQVEHFQDRKVLELELTKKRHIIATIRGNAPYIGLLGTVLGIMLTFYTIDQHGVIYFNSTKVALEELSVKIGGVDRNTPLIVRADRDITLQIFVDVLDLLNSRGFKKVAIQTERKG